MKKVKAKLVINTKWLNPEIAPFLAWTFIMFMALALPPFLGLGTGFVIGLIVWLLLLMQVGSWFAQSFQRYMEEVKNG